MTPSAALALGSLLLASFSLLSTEAHFLYWCFKGLELLVFAVDKVFTAVQRLHHHCVTLYLEEQKMSKLESELLSFYGLLVWQPKCQIG